jgi:hypothetical protein
MIHGTAVFSMADLNGDNSHLYAKYRRNKFEIIDCECIEENKSAGVTEVLLVTGQYDLVKTKKLFDFKHSDIKLW